MKVAVFSMDIEDWYHLDYFQGINCNKEYSLLDGLNNYLEIIKSNNIPSSFFILDDVLKKKNILKDLLNKDYDIGSHGSDHTRPLKIELEKFKRDLKRSKNNLEDALGKQVKGYRAPCFSLDRDRLNIVKQIGFKYDSSKIDFGLHPLYGNLNMDNYIKVENNIFKKGNFFEFENSTTSVFNKKIPISGGGYLRILPWFFSKYLIDSYIKKGDLFTLYVHPFEFSLKLNPVFSKEISWTNRLRFSQGRSTTSEKFIRLIEILKKEGYSFMNFSTLRDKLLSF